MWNGLVHLLAPLDIDRTAHFFPLIDPICPNCFLSALYYDVNLWPAEDCLSLFPKVLFHVIPYPSNFNVLVLDLFFIRLVQPNLVFVIRGINSNDGIALHTSFVF